MLVSSFLSSDDSPISTDATTGIRLVERLRQGELTQAQLETWLLANLETNAGCRILESWIRASPDLTGVESALEIWLLANDRRLRLSFIIRAWLESGGSPELVRGALLGWLDAKSAADHKMLINIWLAAAVAASLWCASA